MKTYTIIGIYADNLQRHSTTVQGKSPADAQKAYARIMNVPMLIAGVIEPG